MAVVLSAAWPCHAQTDAPRATGPFAGLFGGNQGDQGGRLQSLDLRGVVTAEYDKNLTRDSDSTAFLPPYLLTGPVAGVSGSAAYVRHTRRAQFFLNGDGSFREYSAASDASAGSYRAGTGVSANLGAKTLLSTHADFQHLPFYAFGPFGGSTFPGSSLDATSSGTVAAAASYQLDSAFGFAAASQRNNMFDGYVGLLNNYSRRSSLSADIAWQQIWFPDSAINNLRQWRAQGTFQHHLTRALVFHAGYGRDEALYSTMKRVPMVYHMLDVGLAYGDAITFARRTSVSFNTSTSVIRVANQSFYRLNGDVMLTRGFGRTWSSAIGYVRATDFVPAFGQPVLTDSAVARVSGLVRPRVQWSAHVDVGAGTAGFGSSGRFTSYIGGTQAQVALTRSLGLFGQFLYYRYQVPAGSPTLLLPLFARSTFTIGLRLWVPLINQARLLS